MRRVLSALALLVLVSLLTAVTPSPAAAGEYEYGNSYRHHDQSYTASSSCCYRRVVRYERVYRESYDRSYYGHHRHHADYDDRSYTTSRYNEPRRYYGDDYASSYASSCYRPRIRLDDGRGGWVWAKRADCY